MLACPHEDSTPRSRPASVYDGLPDAVASVVLAAAKRIRVRKRGSILDTGRDLLAVKAALPHGRFRKWLAAEFAGTSRTARNYMSVAETFGSKPEIISLLPPAILYRVAQAPESVRDQIVEFVAAGGAIDFKVVRHILSKPVNPEEEMWRWQWNTAERESAAESFVKILHEEVRPTVRARLEDLLELTRLEDILERLERRPKFIGRCWVCQSPRGVR